MRTAGIDVSSDAIPWWYAPVWLLAQLPIVVSAAALGGAVLMVAGVLGQRWGMDRASAVSIAPFVMQGLGLLVAVIVTSTQLYDGIRHLIFLLPAIIALAAVPVAVLDTHQRVTLAGVLALVVVAVSLFASVRWAPYAYAHVNPIAGHDREQRDWDLDYWGVSAREGVEQLRGLGIADIVVVPHGEPGRPFGGQNLQDPGSGIEDPLVFTPEPGVPFGYFWFERFEWPLHDYDCTPLFMIERDGHKLGQGGTCVTR